MSIDNPPLYSGITFNSQFFIQDEGFTQAQANALYLKKTTPDTASALETFTAGIKTNGIEPLNAGDATIIAGSSGFNSIQIANANSRNATGTIAIGNGTTSSGVISIGSGNASSNTINILNGTYTTFQQMGIVNILSGTVSGSWFGGDMNLFRSAKGTLTIGGSNNSGITFNKEPNFSVGLSSTASIRANTIATFTGGTNTIYTDPNTPQTYNTTVCSNNLACSFGASAGSCNLGGSASAVNIGFNMPSASGASISIGTAGVQDTNVLIATKGAIVTGTNKIQVGASGNALNVVCGTITLGTADSAISIGSSATQSSNILIGTKGAIISGTDKVVIGSSTSNTTISGNNLNLGATSLNINSPLTVGYSPSFTSGQIGYSSSSSFSGVHVNGVNNVVQVSNATLPGVYMISSFSYVAASSFTNVSTYNFEVGYYGGSIISRSYLANSSLNYSNNQQTLAMVYSSAGTPNAANLNLYSAINLTYTSSTGSPVWGIDIYYTRIA
jgi:hypothetical protein